MKLRNKVKLELTLVDLGFLINRLNAIVAGQFRDKFLAQQDPALILSLWTAWCLSDYSLCDLTPQEFIVEVGSGKRCCPEDLANYLNEG